MGIMRTKSIEQSISDTEEPEFQLSKSLGALDLTVFGIGVIIGTGLFVLTGEAAAGYAGPAIALSYVVAGLACALAALCYAEFASTVPVAGSAYTFSYASLGEIVAWLIGWDLILEFTLGAATVAKGWSGYLVSVLDLVGITVPANLAADGSGEGFSHDYLSSPGHRGYVDDPGHRHQAKLPLQPDRNRHEDPRDALHHRLRCLVHRRGEPLTVHPGAEARGRGLRQRPRRLPVAEHPWHRHDLRRHRHLHRGRARVLRLHRLRRRRHDLRGGAQPPEGHTHRDPGLPRHLHRPVHRGLRGLHRAQAVPGPGHRGPGRHGPRGHALSRPRSSSSHQRSS